MNYCIGDDKDKIIDSVSNRMDVTDAILIWEHKEIIDIIRSFDIDIKSWKNKYESIYDIVFMIDIKTHKLFYDCFDFIYNSTNCSKNVDIWLNDFKSITKRTPILYESSNKKIIAGYTIIFSVIFIYVGCYLIYAVINKMILNRQRRDYVVII